MDFSITLIPTVRAAMQTLVGVDGFYSFDLFVTTYADDAHRNLITCHTVPLRLGHQPLK